MPVFFNQENANVLTDLLTLYSKYDKKILEKIEFVIVDDCSPVKISIPENLNINYQLLRITDNIRWNQGGARNLGVVYAKSCKIILTDCDHVFPEKLLNDILNSRIPAKVLYKFKRVDSDKLKLSAACNIFYLSKSLFFNALGYDEEFCGHYGYEDVMFRALQKRINNKLRYFTRFTKIISNKIDRENSYHSLDRDVEINEKLLNRKLILLRSSKPYVSHSRMFLNFNHIKQSEKSILQPTDNA